MACDFRQIRPSPFEDEEMIEAIRIRLYNAHTTAVLTEFRAADRVLAGWLVKPRGALTIDFQVTFCDGFVFFGCYKYDKRKRCVPRLSDFVRTSLEALTAAQPAWLPKLSRYTVLS